MNIKALCAAPPKAFAHSGIAGKDSMCRSFGLWRIDDKTVTLWESLDVLGSRESITAGKGALRFGPGVEKKIVEFNKTQRMQIKPTGAALAILSGVVAPASPSSVRVQKRSAPRKKARRKPGLAR